MELKAKFKLLIDEGDEFSKSLTLFSNNSNRAIKQLNTQEKGNH